MLSCTLSVTLSLTSDMGSLFYTGSATVAVIILDQLTKWWATSITTIPLIGDWFRFHYAENTGIAFSLPVEGIILQVVTVLFIALLAVLYSRMRAWDNAYKALSFGLVFGGALGNALDRFFRGFVVDFISVGSFPIFNIADIAVTVGVVLLLYVDYRETKHT